MRTLDPVDGIHVVFDCGRDTSSPADDLAAAPQARDSSAVRGVEDLVIKLQEAALRAENLRSLLDGSPHLMSCDDRAAIEDLLSRTIHERRRLEDELRTWTLPRGRI